jgi:hypothetical protein
MSGDTTTTVRLSFRNCDATERPAKASKVTSAIFFKGNSGSASAGQQRVEHAGTPLLYLTPVPVKRFCA